MPSPTADPAARPDPPPARAPDDPHRGAVALEQASPPTAWMPPPCWPSQALLGRGAEAHIRHGDALYRLRLTRQGKLILTK